MAASQQVKVIMAAVCLLAVLMLASQGTGAALIQSVYVGDRKKLTAKRLDVRVIVNGDEEETEYMKTHGVDTLGRVILGGIVKEKASDPLETLKRLMANVSSPRVIIAGPPAGGKGTQCEILVKTFGFVHISTGDLLRAEVSANTQLGVTAQGYMTKGELVPDDIVIGMLLKKINEPEVKAKGWLLDGFPRTVNQARVMLQEGINADCIVVLDVPDEVVTERISGRRTDPETGIVYHLKYRPPPEDIKHRLKQRQDDTPAAIKERLVQYHRNVNPLLTSFTCPIHRIPAGSLGPKDVSAMVTNAVQSTRWAALAATLGVNELA
eukprot:TRINITY_DN33946_c0_g1_i1.p1 TRINITY_DN33946_c0_g1~~TRINITY_DN33946_c0_g1_i1.p1  ORF type:complete len:323 (+),score=57.64 TRINITY_DN33946_c0_g1_i1:86-1054(+)